MEQFITNFDQAILQFFAQMRSPVLNAVFSFFSFLGEGTVLAAVVILFYWLSSTREGEQLALTAVSSLSLNVYLKTAIARPRPYVAGAINKVEVDNFFVSTNNLSPNASFPSGHSQSASSFLTGNALCDGRWWAWLLYMLLTLLIMISRLYLGVHYPTDVLAGFAIGFVIALVWEWIYRNAYRARYYILAALAVLALVPLFFSCPHDYVKTAGLIAGAAVFLPFANMVERRPRIYTKHFLRIILGAFATGAAFLVTLLFPEGDEGFTLIKYFMIVGGATFLSQLLFRLFKA